MNSQSATKAETVSDSVEVSDDASTLLSELKLILSQLYDSYAHKIALHCKLFKNEWHASINNAALAFFLLLILSALVMTGWIVVSLAVGATIYSMGGTLPLMFLGVFLAQIVLGVIVWKWLKLTITKIGFSQSLSYLSRSNGSD